MKSFLSIPLAALAILFLSHGLQVAANGSLAEIQQQQQEHEHYFENIQMIKDIKTFIPQNPDLPLMRLTKQASTNDRSQSVKYTLGNRVAGDHMVGQYANTFYYSTPQDVSKSVIHHDNSSVVTYVDINCLQDNGEGNAYVVAGGIGQRFITLMLEAKETKRFTYNVHVYGTN